MIIEKLGPSGGGRWRRGAHAADAFTTAEKSELSELRRDVKRLRQERDILKRRPRTSPRRASEYPFIKAQEVAFSVNVMCRLREGSRSGYYAWKRRPEAPIDAAKVAATAEIAAAHRRSRGTYGSPRIHRELRARRVRISRKRVERLMREKGLKGAQKRRFRCTTDSRHTLPIAPNELARNFEPDQPDRVWAGDVTYIATEEGSLYLAVMLELFSRRVVGWSVSAPTTPLASDALRRALASRRPAAGLLHHTDGGSPHVALAHRDPSAAWHHREHEPRRRLITTMQSWRASSALKAELVGGHIYPSRAAATAAIGDLYNPQRRHSHLQYLTDRIRTESQNRGLCRLVRLSVAAGEDQVIVHD